ncbi:MAG: aspartyl protease family protein, partial [Candidatus Eremiobacteraeota bacterium]|nr:aspartyl protease family protein [Candidatus Eremiobacteraeota bacterium]
SKWSHANSGFVHEWTKISANQNVSDSDLHPPAMEQHWSFGSGKPFPAKYVDNDYQRGIFVDASVNGVQGHFKIDTGSYSILLTQKFAERARVKHIGTSTSTGIGPKAIHPNIDLIESMRFGDNTLSNMKETSADLEFGKDREGQVVDGLIGFDLFGGAIVGLNMDSNEMTLSDPATTAVDTSKGLNVVVDLANLTPHLPMKIDGRIPVQATLDTGSYFNIMYAQDLESKYGLVMVVDQNPNAILNTHVFMGGVGGSEFDKCGTLDSATLGPIVYQTPTACSSRSLTDRDILLGVDFIKHFNLVFDYPHSQIIMTPRKE